MEPKNHPIEKENHLFRPPFFLVPAVNFPGCSWFAHLLIRGWVHFHLKPMCMLDMNTQWKPQVLLGLVGYLDFRACRISSLNLYNLVQKNGDGIG